MEKQYQYKKGKEIKINKLLSLHESVCDSIQERLDTYGGKLSSLVENLLIKWAEEFDMLQRISKKIDKLGVIKNESE